MEKKSFFKKNFTFKIIDLSINNEHYIWMGLNVIFNLKDWFVWKKINNLVLMQQT